MKPLPARARTMALEYYEQQKKLGKRAFPEEIKKTIDKDLTIPVNEGLRIDQILGLFNAQQQKEERKKEGSRIYDFESTTDDDASRRNR